MGVTSRKWIKDCIDHWSRSVDECDLGTDWSEANERCWRCGYKRNLQKCHIIPRQLGGQDDTSNIVPLCARCHDEMPDVADSKAVWEWIRRTRVACYDEFWIRRTIEVALATGLALPESLHDSFMYEFAANLKNIGVHLSQGHVGAFVKQESISWCARIAAEKVKGA